MNFTEKGPDYLIIDNFLEHFGLTKEVVDNAETLGEILATFTLRPHLN